MHNTSPSAFMSKYCQYGTSAASSYRPILIGMPMHRFSSNHRYPNEKHPIQGSKGLNLKKKNFAAKYKIQDKVQSGLD